MLTDSGPILLPRPQGRFLYRVCGVAFETASVHPKRRAYTRNGERTPETASVHRVTRRADPARARHAPSGGVGSRCKRAAFASQSRCWEYWSVYGVTPRAPGVFEAVRRIEEHSNGMPR